MVTTQSIINLTTFLLYTLLLLALLVVFLLWVKGYKQQPKVIVNNYYQVEVKPEPVMYCPIRIK